MNTFNLYKNANEYSVADSLADVFAAQEAEELSEKNIEVGDVSDSAVKTILAQFPADENFVIKAGNSYRWTDKLGHSVSVKHNSKSGEYTLAINHNFAGLFSNSQWSVSDANGLDSVSSTVNSLVKHAELLETRSPSLLKEIDSVLAFIENDILKLAEVEEYEDVDLSDMDDHAVDIDVSDLDDKPVDIDVSDLEKEHTASSIMDSVMSNFSSGHNLSNAIESVFGKYRSGPATESKMRNDLEVTVENVAHLAADQAEEELISKLGLSKEEAEELGSKVYFKLSEILSARAENLLELAFERIKYKAGPGERAITVKKYDDRKDLLNEHLADPENSELRKHFSE
jgi:hypothetical protein